MFGEKMNKRFLEKVRHGDVKAPTQKGFTLESWKQAWEKSNLELDLHVYQAGIVVHEVLSEIRESLREHYQEKNEGYHPDDLIKAFFAISNRDRFIASKPEVISGKYIHSASNNNNSIGNELSIQEIADGCVDGISKAVHNSVKKITSQNKVKGKEELVSPNVMEFSKKEATLSSIYESYEGIWHGVLWGGYKFEIIDSRHKVVKFSQPKVMEELAYYVSQVRRSRLHAQSVAVCDYDKLGRIFAKDKCLIPQKIGRKKTLVCKDIEKVSDDIKKSNIIWRAQQYSLYNDFPEKFIDEVNTSLGFSVYEALDVFRVLILMAASIEAKYPVDTNVSNSKKLFEYCYEVEQYDLVRSLSYAVNMDREKVKNILEFLTFEGRGGEDLWSNPLVLISKKKYAILTSALVTPVFLRVVEHWLVQMGTSLGDKGDIYEKNITNRLGDTLYLNTYIKDFDKPISKHFKLKTGKEEIDLIFRIGNVVVVGEAKCIVTTDSPISKFRASDTLKHGAKQAKRKADFVRNNLSDVFDCIDWSYDSSVSYDVVPVVINSSKIMVGCHYYGVPVIDDAILIRYFESNTFPLLSLYDHNSNLKHYAWLTLYNNSSEIVNHFSKYIAHPPQVDHSFDQYEYKDIIVPCINDFSYKAIYSRLVSKDGSYSDKINRGTCFPITFSEDYQELKTKIQVLM